MTKSYERIRTRPRWTRKAQRDRHNASVLRQKTRPVRYFRCCATCNQVQLSPDQRRDRPSAA